MDNNNPAEMSNADLERDMQQNKLTGNQEDVSKSTAAEGVLKTPPQDASSAVHHHTARNQGDEQDLDDLVHKQGAENIHNGNLPGPDDIPEWEDEEIDGDDKISS